MTFLSELSPEARARFDAYLEPLAFAPGEVIVREGGDGREMYVVLEGEGRIRRADLDLGGVGPGDHFGELALVAGRPRAATVVAASAMRVGKLGLDRFQALIAHDPDIAAKLLSALVSRLGAQLTEMTDSVGDLLRERSLPRRTRVRVQFGDEAREVPTGTEFDHLLPKEVDGARVVAALVDGTATSLGAPVTAHARLAPLLESHWEGERVLRDSLHLLVLEAATLANVPLRLGASVASSTWIELDPKDDAIGRLERAMRELVARDVAFHEEWWTLEEARAYFEEVGRRDTSLLLSTFPDTMVPLVTCGRVYALRNGPVVPRASFLARFELEPAPMGALLTTGPRPPGVEATAAWADVMREHARWIEALGVGTVGAFDRACVDGDVSEIVRVAEGWHEKRLGRIADQIAARPDVRVVCIAGPSSSGKTTFIKRLRVQLQVVGIDSALVSLDDYYVDRDKTPRDAAGEYDFEALDALDLELLRAHLGALLAGKSVRTARYDFLTGKSARGGGKTIELRKQRVLMLEGIHGLNPALVGSVQCDPFRVFIQPLTSLPLDVHARVSPSDLRLVRRIVRDRRARGYTPGENILRWPSVRRGERLHVFPYVDRADVVFDTSLVYEPSVLKTYAERYLLEVPPDHPAHPTAVRLRTLVDRFVAIHPAHVPPTSILREFIGESGFEY